MKDYILAHFKDKQISQLKITKQKSKLRIRVFAWDFKTYTDFLSFLEFLNEEHDGDNNDWEITSSCFYNCDDQNYLITITIQNS